MTLSRLTACALATLCIGSVQSHAQDVADWSGFYASVFGGYALDTEASSGTTLGPSDLPLGGAASVTIERSSGRINGPFGGIAGGYNYQHDRLVMGIEASAGLGGFGKANAYGVQLEYINGANTANIVSDQRSAFDINWYTSLQGRLGLAHEKWLFFLKGGAVVADISVAGTAQFTSVDPAGIVLGNVSDVGTSAFSQVLVGPAFGFGTEVMMAENVSISAEYSYVGLPDVTAPATGIYGPMLGTVATTFSGGMHQLKAGVSYHF